MSEMFRVIGDLDFIQDVAVWRAAIIDKKAVGKLTKWLGPLQGELTVAEALDAVRDIADVGGRVTVVGSRVTVRAVVTDHQLHDLAAPLIGAFRLAGRSAGMGGLWFLIGDEGEPDFGHVLDVDGNDSTVRELRKKELPGAAKHARDDLDALVAGLMNAPPKPASEGPSALREVPLKERPAYAALYAECAAAAEGALREAIARASAWVHPASHLDPDLVALAQTSSRDELLAALGDANGTRHRGRLDTLFAIVPWLAPARAPALLRVAATAGVFTGYLTDAIRALLANGHADIAWELFEAANDDKKNDLNLWFYRAGAVHALGTSTIATADLVARLDDALKKKTQAAMQKRIEGLCLALAWRTNDTVAQAAVDGAVAVAPDKLRACLVHYAQQNGWTPN